MNAEILDSIEKEYAAIRQKNADNVRKRRDLALSNQKFAANDKRIKELDFEISRLECFEMNPKAAAPLKAERDSLKTENSALLKGLGMTEDDLAPSFDCAICRDTGTVDGVPCACFKEKWARHTLALLGAGDFVRRTFADDKAKKPEGLEKIYSAMRRYVEKFPDGKIRNFVFTGKTGCGKTFLASAVAGELEKKGFNCIFLSAVELNGIFLKMYTTKYSDSPDYMRILTDCDLLVIDDLGAENLYANVTIECLLALVSERLARRKHTLITTNLTPDEIMTRYNDRFFSRVTEKASSAVLKFDDINFRLSKEI